MVEFLDDDKVLEFVEFNPTVEAPTTWTPSEMMAKLLKKTFNCCLPDTEKNEILSDFPKPNTQVLVAPKLDNDVIKQLKRKGKDPHFS